MLLMRKEMKDNLFLITYGIILFVLLMNYEWIFEILGFLGHILTPFVIGMVVALLLNVLVNILEEKALKKLNKYKRVISVVLSILIVVLFIAFLMLILIPQLKNAGTIFAQNIPKYQETIYSIGETFGLSENELEILNLENNRFKEEISALLSRNSDKILDFSMGFASSVISVLCNTFIGIVFAIYLLIGKETLLDQMKRLFSCLMPKTAYDKLVEVAKLSNVTFSNFIKVQCLEAVILGSLCFVGMLLFRLPYAATISVLVGVTALIPVFGAFIGCVIGAFLIFMINPIKAVTFIIFFLVLQQIEGNFIYPRVVGGKIGLPSIWVLVAVTIGGSVGGVLGMLLGVPFVSVVYSLIKVFVNKRSPKKEVKVVKKNEA